MHAHKWNTNPPTKGKSWCVKCNQVYRGKGRPIGSGAGAPSFGVPLDDESQSVLVDLASEMTGVVAEPVVEDTFDNAPQEQSSQSTSTAIAPQEQPSGWTAHAGVRIAKLFVMACETVGDLMKPKRIPKEPEQVDVEEFGKAMGLQLAVWFPNSELSPMKRLILAGAAIGGSMYIGSKKVEETPKEKPTSAQPAATNSHAKTPEQVRDTVAPTAAAIFGGSSF